MTQLFHLQYIFTNSLLFFVKKFHIALEIEPVDAAIRRLVFHVNKMHNKTVLFFNNRAMHICEHSVTKT